MQHYSGIQRYGSLGRCEQRIDVDLLDARLLDDELAETNKQFFQRHQVDRCATAHARQRAMNLGPLHHAPRKGAVQRRQAESSIAKDLNQLTARAEEQHWAKLRINAAAEDELIPVAPNHRLHDNASKIFNLA